jgi:hypothetical protein
MIERRLRPRSTSAGLSSWAIAWIASRRYELTDSSANEIVDHIGVRQRQQVPGTRDQHVRADILDWERPVGCSVNLVDSYSFCAGARLPSQCRPTCPPQKRGPRLRQPQEPRRRAPGQGRGEASGGPRGYRAQVLRSNLDSDIRLPVGSRETLFRETAQTRFARIFRALVVSCCRATTQRKMRRRKVSRLCARVRAAAKGRLRPIGDIQFLDRRRRSGRSQTSTF